MHGSGHVSNKQYINGIVSAIKDLTHVSSLIYPPHCLCTHREPEYLSWSCKALNFLISHTFHRKRYISIARTGNRDMISIWNSFRENCPTVKML